MPKTNEPRFSDLNDINAQLVLAIFKSNLDLVHKIMDHGTANPFATPNECAIIKEGRKLSAFEWAMKLHDDEIAGVLLDKFEGTFDFSQPIENIRNKKPMNWIQYAFLNSDADVAITMIEYQLSKFPNTDIAALINKKFHYNMPCHGTVLTTIGSVLAWKVSNSAIASNLSLSECTDKESVCAFFKEWITAPEYKKTTRHAPDNLKLHIYHLDQLKALLRYGFDPSVTDHSGRSLNVLLRDLVRYSKDVQLWETWFRPYAIWEGVEQTGPATLRNGRIEAPIKVKRLTSVGETSQDELYTFNVPLYEGMLIEVDPKVALANGRTNTILENLAREQKQQGQQIKQVAKTVEDIQTHLSRLSEVQFNKAVDALASKPFYQAVFTRMHLQLAPYLQGKRDAHLGLYKTNPSNKNLAMARDVLTIIGVAADFTPVPGVAAIPALLSGALYMATEFDAARRDKNTFNKLQVNTDILATMVCQVLVNEAAKTYGKNINKINSIEFADALVAKVKKQANNINKMSSEGSMDTVAFLCVTALNDLLSVQNKELVVIPSSSRSVLLFGSCFASNNAVYKPSAMPKLVKNSTGSTSSSDRDNSGEKPEREYYATISNGSAGSATPPRSKLYVQ